MDADEMNRTRMVRRARLRHFALATALALLPQTLWAQGGGQFQQPPIIEATELLPASVLSGPGFYFERLVPTNGAMGRYTIVADEAVFHEDAGAYEVESLDLLKVRLSEIPAIRALEDMSKTAVFANALASSVERPVRMGVQMVAHPLDTVTGLPSGIGEFFGRVSLGAGELWSTAKNATQNGGERASETAGETADITLTALGYDQVRRNLARRLHVDPYTTNPILKEKLNQVAWVMFSARFAVNTAITVAVPGSMLISGTEFTNDLVYQTPKGDLILLVEKKLKDMGLSQSEIAAFSHNNAVALSVQVSAATDLESLGAIPGRRAVAVALGSVLTEYQARFLAVSIKMLSQWGRQKSPITAIAITGPLIARDQNNTVIMPAPVDYVSWTPRIAGFATSSTLVGQKNRVLWIPAKMTPLAQQQLETNGWTIRDKTQP
ncbi:MAG: hypothetical protein C5B58_11215 [Acidobacteria bacterium]|nr:MAG: hypothetical protein C5B58_11215 [Acidobacteriota bacterium]